MDLETLVKIKNFKKEIEQLKEQLKQSKQEIKQLKLVQKNLLTECDILCARLAEHLPFTDSVFY